MIQNFLNRSLGFKAAFFDYNIKQIQWENPFLNNLAIKVTEVVSKILLHT